MNLDKNINDIVSIFNAFKENDDFYHELMKEAYSIGNESEARKITRARDEFKNGYKISQDTVELIKTNFDKYVKIINVLNEKNNQNKYTTSNDTYSMDLNSNELQNESTLNVTSNNTTANNNRNSSSSTEDEKDDEKNIQPIFNNSNNSEVENNIQELDDSNYAYSSTIAKQNLERKLATINNQISIIRNNINNSEKMPSKKEYQQLFQLESYRDKLTQRLESIKLEESYGDNERIESRDQKLAEVNTKIKENREKLQSDKPKFIKAVISHRLNKLKEKQGRIKVKQRTVVNKALLKYYKDSFKASKSDSHDKAVNQYYQDKRDLLKEKKESILDNLDNNKGIIATIKNKFYKLRSLPISARISYIEGLQQKEGKLNGFKHLNKDIANKLYPRVQKVKNNTRQIIEQLKQMSGYLKSASQSQQFNPEMEELINNLVPDQPTLEEVSSMHR